MKHRASTEDYREVEVLVKWKHYEISDSTWEPLNSIYTHVKRLADDYFERKNLKPFYKDGEEKFEGIISALGQCESELSQEEE